MYYRLSYSYEDISDIKCISTSADMAEIEAWELIGSHNKIGTVIIDRRPSEYYGDYKHVLTIAHGLDNDIMPELSMGNVPSSGRHDRYIKRLCAFKQIIFDEEPKDFKKLMWICECKTLALKDSETLNMLKDLQRKQIELILKVDESFEHLVENAEYYGFADALLMN